MTTRLLKVDLNGAVWKAKRGAGLSTTLEAVRADVQSSAPSAVWGQLLLDDALHLGGVLEPFLVFFFFFPSLQEDPERKGSIGLHYLCSAFPKRRCWVQVLWVRGEVPCVPAGPCSHWSTVLGCRWAAGIQQPHCSPHPHTSDTAVLRRGAIRAEPSDGWLLRGLRMS